MQDALDEATDSWGVKVSTDNLTIYLLDFHLFLFAGREGGDVSRNRLYYIIQIEKRNSWVILKNVNSYHKIYLH